MREEIKNLNEHWTNIYYHLHYQYEGKITHQAIRILQLIQKENEITINNVADYMGISPNTASEHVKRLITKRYLKKERDLNDERKVKLILTAEGKNVVHLNTSLDEKKLSLAFRNLSDKDMVKVLEAFELLSESAKKCN